MHLGPISGFTDPISFGGMARGSTGENGVGKSMISKSTPGTSLLELGITWASGKDDSEVLFRIKEDTGAASSGEGTFIRSIVE